MLDQMNDRICLTYYNQQSQWSPLNRGFQNNTIPSVTLLGSVMSTLRTKWWQATFGGEDRQGINPLEWWEDIVESERLPPLFGERLVELAAPMWITQIEGL